METPNEQMKGKVKEIEMQNVEHHEIKNTPFTAVKHKDKYYILCGDTAITQKTFDNLKQCNEYVAKKDWNTIANFVLILVQKINEHYKNQVNNNK